jgi:hypothetical protein
MGNAKNRRKVVTYPPLCLDAVILDEPSALVSSLTRYIARTYKNSGRFDVQFEEISNRASAAYGKTIADDDISDAIEHAIAAFAIYRPYGNSHWFNAFAHEVKTLTLAERPNRDREEYFKLTLLGNADFLAVASFAGIFVDHDEDGHRDTYRFLQQNAHKWVIEARPFDVELAYDNEHYYPQVDQQVRIVEVI